MKQNMIIIDLLQNFVTKKVGIKKFKKEENINKKRNKCCFWCNYEKML